MFDCHHCVQLRKSHEMLHLFAGNFCRTGREDDTGGFGRLCLSKWALPKRLQAWWEWNLQQYLGHQAEMGQIGDILVSMGYCWMHLVECQEIHQICSHPFHSFSKDCFRCPQPQRNQSALREICDRFLKGYGLSLLNLVICHKRSCGHGWCDKKKRSTAWKHVRFNYFQSVAFWW